MQKRFDIRCILRFSNTNVFLGPSLQHEWNRTIIRLLLPFTCYEATTSFVWNLRARYGVLLYLLATKITLYLSMQPNYPAILQKWKSVVVIFLFARKGRKMCKCAIIILYISSCMTRKKRDNNYFLLSIENL